MNLFKKRKKKNAEPFPPIIQVTISLDGAFCIPTSQGIAQVVDLIGDEDAVKWHAFYMQKFTELKNDCWTDLNKLCANKVAELESNLIQNTKK